MTLSDLNEAFEAIGKIVVTNAFFNSMPAPWLSNGFYKITFPDWSHKIFRIRFEQQGEYRGHRTVAILIGPDESDDFEIISIVKDDKFETFMGKKTPKLLEHLTYIWELSRGEKIEGYSLQVVKRCRLCNRVLASDEETQRTELGEACRKKVGIV